VYGVITTHYTNLKLYAGESQGVVNGAMQFDVANISPLFSLEQGLPGNSFAFELARKIGLPEDIVKTAEEKAGSEFVDMERQLRKIARGRRALDEKLTRVKNADRTLEGLTERYEKELSEIKSLKNSILAEARAEAREIIAGANRQIEQTIREIKEAQAEKEKTKQARRKVTEMNETLATESVPDETDLMIERKMQQIVARKEREQKRREERRQRSGSEAAPAAKAADKTDNSPLKVGDKVKVKESDMVGEIVQISAKKVLLAIGAITSRMDISKVERISAQHYKNLSRSNSNASHTTTGGFSVKGMESVAEHKLNFSPTIDIRGQHLEEALATVTGFIDDAIMVGAGTVKILHGKGNGVLREEIRKYLKTMGGIRSMADEDIRFGGSGITVVELD
ncbi:MAG: Smr/MutS family protein, partial [Bacteroidales bacterium]|nr:Smr/MutS family protein [Bacteroidales bacterium]